MIRYALAGIALCAGAAVASAQDGPPDGSTRKKMEEMQAHQAHDVRELRQAISVRFLTST